MFPSILTESEMISSSSSLVQSTLTNDEEEFQCLSEQISDCSPIDNNNDDLIGQDFRHDDVQLSEGKQRPTKFMLI